MARAKFSLAKTPLPTQNLLVNAVETARSQSHIDLVPPGHIALEPKARGGRYAYWCRFVAGKLERQYLGPEGEENHQAAAAELEQLKLHQAAAKSLRKLGFESVEHDAALVIAELSNAGVFAGGGVLIGTRAFGALLNTLGWQATPHLGTQDVDLARPAALKLVTPLGDDGFFQLLQKTGLRFAPVMGLERPPGPPTSYKVVGKDLKVDLLVPSRLKTKPYATVSVKELGAHATSLPFLQYLTDAPSDTLVIGRDHLIPVRVPQPGRYAMHKLVVADIRSGADNPKVEKDLVQAGILAAILTSDDQEELLTAARDLTPAMRKHARNSLPRWRQIMGASEYRPVVDLVTSALEP